MPRIWGMSTNKKQKNQALVNAANQQISRSDISFSALLSKLPNWALVPTMVGVFGLLLTDLAVADPLPFVDEAALLWALVSGMKVLGTRRRARRDVGKPPELDVVGEVELDHQPAPGQPLHVPQG